MRYFVRLGYNGTPFHGWQRQPNAGSVQQTLEESLSTIMRAATPVVGAGRTDTGVHAHEMYAHFDTERPIPDVGKMIQSLTRLSGHDIAIHDIIEVHEEAHARFDATSRTYKYIVCTQKSPFLQNLAAYIPGSLDVEKMNRAAAMLLDTSDFTSFAKLHSDAKTNICDVTEAKWRSLSSEGRFSDVEPDPEVHLPVEGLVFTITANRFLRNMVRAVVGTLVDVGRGKISLEDFADIIKAKDRCSAGTSMPPQALYLWRVEYPYITR